MVRRGLFSQAMKKVLLQFALVSLSTALLTTVSQAQDDLSPSASTPANRSSSGSTNLISKPTNVSVQGKASHVMASRLIGSKVKSTTGENVGQIDDILMDQNGQIKVAVLGVGGFLGIGEKKTPVPWQGLQPTATHDFTLNVDRQKLKTAPVIDKNQTAAEWATPTFMNQVYAHYGMQEPSGCQGAQG
jgi:sporulation protein YlmC with PRC-barrel domain